MLINTKWYYYQAIQLARTSYWKLQKNIFYLKESQIINALVNAVVAKIEIIDNHVSMITSLITSVTELTATNTRLASQLANALGRQKDYFPWPKTDVWRV